MDPCHIHGISTPDTSRLRAFEAQSVILKHPWRSWSGVRHIDGVVVFAIPEGDVQADDGGSRCLLWWREADARFGQQESMQRLAHCQVAAWQGSAEGILVRSAANVACRETIELRVERVAEQYWALWGSAAQARRLREVAPGRREFGGLTSA